jgi:hypothetical protein
LSVRNLAAVVTGGLAGLFLGCGSIFGIQVVSVEGEAGESKGQADEEAGRPHDGGMGEAEGGTVVTVLASQIQLPPNLIVSDGTSLFWTTSPPDAGCPFPPIAQGLFSMPVGGGTVTTLLDVQPVPDCTQPGPFLAVDDVNVYALAQTATVQSPVYSLMRIPKNGAAATLVNEAGTEAACPTSLGGTVYWIQIPHPNLGVSGCGSTTMDVATFMSAPLLGGTVATLAMSVTSPPCSIAVTSKTLVVEEATNLLSFYFSLTGAGFAPPACDPPSRTLVTPGPCIFLTSDTDAVYCASATGSNLRIAGDGTFTPLGLAVNSSYIVFDDTYVYWVDSTTVGAIKKAPKAGGGNATVLAWDTNPTGIGIDANSIYWGNQQGYIKSIPR